MSVKLKKSVLLSWRTIRHGNRNSDAIAKYQSLQCDLILARHELLETITKCDRAIQEYNPRITRLRTDLLKATQLGRKAISDLTVHIKFSNYQHTSMGPIIVFPQELIVDGFLPDAAPKIERSEILRSNGKYGLADFSDVEGYLRIYGLYYVNNFQFFLERETISLSKLIDQIDQALRIFSIPIKMLWPIAQTKLVKEIFGANEAEEFISKARKVRVVFDQRIRKIDEDIASLNELAIKLSRFELNGE